MHAAFEADATAPAIPIHFVTASTWDAVAKALSEPARRFAQAQNFRAAAGKCLVLPGASGAVEAVLFGLDEATSPKHDPFRPGQLPGLLPPGTYRFANAPHDARLATLAYDATALVVALGTARRGVGGPFDVNALRDPAGFSGIDGIFRFGSNGLVQRGLAVLQIQPDGSTIVIDSAPQSFTGPIF